MKRTCRCAKQEQNTNKNNSIKFITVIGKMNIL